MTATFAITRESANHLRASGRIDVGNAALALEHCRGSFDPAAATTVDLGALESADSVTLAVLLAWAARASARGGRLECTAVPPRLQALAHLSAAERLLGMAPAAPEPERTVART